MTHPAHPGHYTMATLGVSKGALQPFIGTMYYNNDACTVVHIVAGFHVLLKNLRTASRKKIAMSNTSNTMSSSALKCKKVIVFQKAKNYFLNLELSTPLYTVFQTAGNTTTATPNSLLVNLCDMLLCKNEHHRYVNFFS
jgi:hypothetical protein